jgi:hypothetical protein
MATFVPGFEHDIFISYAQVDNEPVFGTEKGWVSSLADGLRILLARKLGRADAFSLWMDVSSLSRHKAVTSEIESTLRRTATLILVLSPGYLASKWCQQEREAFLSALGGQPGSRVFVVELTKTESAEKPEVLRDFLGYRFWSQEGDRKLPRTLGYPEPNPKDPKHQPYYHILDELADDLARELKRLKSSVKKS